jgi:hypothetical protein
MGLDDGCELRSSKLFNKMNVSWRSRRDCGKQALAYFPSSLTLGSLKADTFRAHHRLSAMVSNKGSSTAAVSPSKKAGGIHK